MVYKYETHLHTREASACASASGVEQARRYKAAGYDGIIVTDHFFNGNSAVTSYTDWEDRVEQYCLGYEHAKAEGKKIGLSVFFGIEYTYGGADSLIYGIDKDWLLNNPDCLDISYYEFCDRVHEDGGFIVHAHPFREAGYLHEIRLLPEWVDAVEVYNSGNREQIYNDRAKWYAMQFNKPVTAGTDNHHLSTTNLSGIRVKKRLKDIYDYIDAVREHKLRIICNS